MRSYIFLDNWVFPLLSDPEADARLTAFVRSNGFTVLLTSLSMVELYNPGWQRAGEKERGAAAARFLARVPCVIVNPRKVWMMEVAAHLNQLQALPIELDLFDLSAELREAALLGLLRRDDLFLRQGLDIHTWSLDYEEAKKSWPADVTSIIENACSHGYLKQDKAGKFTELEETKELFLFSLDLRHAYWRDLDAILTDVGQRARAGLRPLLTSVSPQLPVFLVFLRSVRQGQPAKAQGLRHR